MTSRGVAIIGAGPAGLMAAEVLSQAGVAVQVFDGMPSVGRKFLLAGIGGLNLTHGEDTTRLCSRYGHSQPHLEDLLREFDGPAVREWAHGLGIETFVGTSNRVFPKDMKAAPLLRAWMHRLRHPGIGKPGVVLVPFGKAKLWYWHLADGRSNWYPSLLVAHGQEHDDWPRLLQQAKAWLPQLPG